LDRHAEDCSQPREEVTMKLWTVLGVVSLGFMAGVAIWAIISPRSQWKKTASWQYRDPAAHEPSEAAYRYSRLAAAVGLIVLTILAIVLLSG
jgi:hypothetical protein